jgi:signal transduction histidine kinase/AmiR/NasT family two-component response regulator
MLGLKQSLDERDQKLAISEENLQNEARILKAILNSIGEGVVVADPNGKFLVFNPAAREILGTGPFDSEVSQWSERLGIYLPDTVTSYPSNELPLARALRGYATDDAEMFVRHEKFPEGAWLSVTARPLIDERGFCRGGVAVFRDSSASKRMEQTQKQAKEAAEHANLAKSEFLSRMSHELRTPLNSILGFAQVLEMTQLTGDQGDSVEHVLKGGRHLLGLINEVLDIARIEAGRLSLSPEPVRVSDALQQALDLVRPLALKQNIGISLDGALCQERHVLADRQRLAQVLLNLLSNAVKYNRAGGTVKLVCEETLSGQVRVEITDTGPGISQEGLSKLFSPFERLNAERSGVEGTGLGLALSKRLMEAMGGAIGVESKPGRGSTFWIELCPLEHPLQQIDRQIESGLHALQERVTGVTGTVLYIEDNLSNLKLMERIVENPPGIRLIAAMQGQLGLDLAREHQPDLIFLDLHLPDLQGDEVLRRLQAHPKTSVIPVTMISADATQGQVERLLAAGAKDYLTKPIDVKRVLQVLDQAASDRESHAERDLAR